MEARDAISTYHVAYFESNDVNVSVNDDVGTQIYRTCAKLPRPVAPL